MDELEIKVNLDILADLLASVDFIALQKQDVIETVLTPEIKAKLAEIDAEFAGKAEEATSKANELEAEIKQAVIAHGKTVKSTFYQAVWVKGKTSWESKLLDGYMLAHPEIAACRKTGEPSCTLRKVG